METTNNQIKRFQDPQDPPVNGKANIRQYPREDTIHFKKKMVDHTDRMVGTFATQSSQLPDHRPSETNGYFPYDKRWNRGYAVKTETQMWHKDFDSPTVRLSKINTYEDGVPKGGVTGDLGLQALKDPLGLGQLVDLFSALLPQKQKDEIELTKFINDRMTLLFGNRSVVERKEVEEFINNSKTLPVNIAKALDSVLENRLKGIEELNKDMINELSKLTAEAVVAAPVVTPQKGKVDEVENKVDEKEQETQGTLESEQKEQIFVKGQLAKLAEYTVRLPSGNAASSDPNVKKNRDLNLMKAIFGITYKRPMTEVEEIELESKYDSKSGTNSINNAADALIFVVKNDPELDEKLLNSKKLNSIQNITDVYFPKKKSSKSSKKNSSKKK